MSDNKLLHFIHGRPVSHTHSTYVTRDKDDEIIAGIRQRNLITIVGARQVGKTSLLQKLQAILSQEVPVVWVDMLPFGKIHDQERWARAFCGQLLRQFEHAAGLKLSAAPPETLDEFTTFWEELASQIPGDQAVIMIDEAGSLPDTVIDPFYPIIRATFLQRGFEGASQASEKLDFVFSGVFEPTQLIRDPNSSPFNIGATFHLSDFTTEELRQWRNQRVSSACKSIITDEVLNAVYTWTGGHPYLSQLLGSLVSAHLQGHEGQSVTVALIDDLAVRLQERASSNLEPLVRLCSQEPLASIVRQVLSGERIPFSYSQNINLLRLYGAITRGPGNMCQIRNRVYEITLLAALGQTSATSRSGRCEDIAELLRHAEQLLKQVERDRLTETNRQTKAQLEAQIEDLRAQRDKFLQEHRDLGCSS